MPGSESWFAKYPNFVPNPHAPLQDEFNRLAEERNWKPDGSRYRKEWRHCVEDSFTAYFGSDVSSLAAWQALCIKVGIADIPASITGCRKVSVAGLIRMRSSVRSSRCNKGLNPDLFVPLWCRHCAAAYGLTSLISSTHIVPVGGSNDTGP